MSVHDRHSHGRPFALAGALLTVASILAPASSLEAQSSEDLFNPAVLHRIDLRVHSQDWQTLKDHFQENTFYPADVEWNGQVVRNSGIRSRGSGSRSPTKPGLLVDFDRYATEQTFVGLKSVVLDNLTQDASGVRESTTMRFFARIGIPAPRESFARIFVNDEYLGLYAVVESVDKSMLARLFGAIGENTQNDGYLFEYNYVDGSPWRFDYLGADLEPYSERFDPKTHESSSDVTKWGPIEELVRLANDTPPAALPSTLASKLDLPALTRFVAAQNFVAENDGFLGYDGMNNFYFYRLEDRDQHVFIAWDDDNAFLSPDFGVTTRHEENVLLRKLMEVPEYRSQYFAVLDEAVGSAGQSDSGQDAGWLESEIRRQLDLIAEAMRDDPSKPYSNDEHAAAREFLLGFAPARIGYVRCEVARQTGQARPDGCS